MVHNTKVKGLDFEFPPPPPLPPGSLLAMFWSHGETPRVRTASYFSYARSCA